MLNISNKLQTPINGIDLLIKFNAFLLIYVIFFTTRTPFDPANYASSFVEETSNVRNQVVNLFLFFSSLIVLVKRYDTILTFIKSEKFLSLFVLLCLVSALWSDFPELSIKRSFQLFIIYLVVIEALLFVDHNVLLKQLKIVVSLYLFINLFAGKFIPAAIDPIFGTWRGMETTKNEFAQTSFYCLLSAIVLFNFNRTKWTKTYDSLLMLLAVYLIYKSHSSTATIAVAIIVFMVSLFMIESIFPKFGFGRSVLGLVFIYILSFGFILLIFSSEIFGLIPGYFGKDMTLSGRVPIWEYVWTEIEKRQLLGYGFATYWVMGHSRILVFADYFEGFMVNQSHNGYLEIILQLGIVGFIFFLFLLVAITYRMIKLNNNLGIIIIVSILTLNFTESVLFKIGAGGVSTFAFISTYTALSVFHFNLRQVNHNEKNLFKYIGESEISYLQSAFTYKKDGFLFKTKR